jgi:hypothetical protein
MKARKHYLIFCLLTIMSGCAEDAIVANNESESPGQEVYFRMTHKNSAWGEKLEGFIIDHSGSIRTYTNSTDWGDLRNQLTTDEVKENLRNTTLSNVAIPKNELKLYTSKIPDLTATEFSKPTQAGADKGQTKFYAYQYDPKSNIYTAVLLSERGDWNTYNKDKAAIELSAWLETFQGKVK